MREFTRLFGMWHGAWPWLAAAMLMSLVTSLANVALMATAGWFITAMAVAGLAGGAMNYFTPSSLIRAAAIVRTGGRWVERVISHDATFRLLAHTRTALFARLEAIAPAGLDDLRSGEVAARLKLDVDRLELVFLRLVAPLAVATATGVVMAAVVTWRGEVLLATVLTTIVVLFGLILPFAMAHAARGAAGAEANAASELRRRTIEHIDGLAALLVTGDDQRRIDRLAALHDQQIAAERSAFRWTVLGQLGIAIASDLAVVAVVGMGTVAITAGRIAGPDLTLMLLLVLSAFEAFAPIPMAAASLNATQASLRRLFDLWDRKPAVQEPSDPAPLPEGYDVVVQAVSLTYPGRTTPALAICDFDLPQGTQRWLDGPSGSGKSTLIDLVVRVRDPDGGEIRLGGVPIQRLALSDLRSRIAVVPQRPHLFTTTIADNLRLFSPRASDDELWEALERVGLRQSVARMPQQLLTYVGQGGARLAGGEVRRMAVARGLVRKDARILVLDEPTEGLDDTAAAAMLHTIALARADRSLLLVSHRRSVLEDGCAVVR